jgi:hypothetical protein
LIEEALLTTGTATLRRRRLPAEQTVWLIVGLIAYNLVRLEMAAIAAELKVAPTQISFAALRFFVEQWTSAAETQTPGAIPRCLSTMRDRMRRFLLPSRRPQRSFRRASTSGEDQNERLST